MQKGVEVTAASTAGEVAERRHANPDLERPYERLEGATVGVRMRRKSSKPPLQIILSHLRVDAPISILATPGNLLESVQLGQERVLWLPLLRTTFQAREDRSVFEYPINVRQSECLWGLLHA
jgi:hypothetical protein